MSSLSSHPQDIIYKMKFHSVLSTIAWLTQLILQILLFLALFPSEFYSGFYFMIKNADRNIIYTVFKNLFLVADTN